MLEGTSCAARIQAKNLFHGLTLATETERLWSEAMDWARPSINATATSFDSGMKSPFEMLHGRSCIMCSILATGATQSDQANQDRKPGRAVILLWTER